MSTINDCLDRLKPTQLDFILKCVQAADLSTGLHRGTLPFLRRATAVTALKLELAYPKRSGNLPNDRYVRRLLGILSEQLYEDEASIKMFLRDAKVLRYKSHCHNTGKLCLCYTQFKPHELVRLEKIKKDTWCVTAHRNVLDKITTILAETMR